MIATDGATVAHLGGPRGDRLHLSRGGEPFRALGDLGWNARAQTTPQRRLLLCGEDLFVLEPAEGPLLLPPLRVRRLDLEGRERGVEEGADASEDASLHFHATREGPGPVRVVRMGVDPATGRPLLREGTIATGFVRRPHHCYGRPCFDGTAWWYPVREQGLLRAGPDGVREWDGRPSPVAEAVLGRVVCAGRASRRPGAWVDGTWHRVKGPPLFPPWRSAWSGLAAPGPGGSIVLLRREGGELPAIGGAPGRLPPGIYSALAEVGGRLLAVAEEDPPRLLPVGF